MAWYDCLVIVIDYWVCKVEEKVSQEFLAVAVEPFCMDNALVHTIELETWLLKGMRS